MGTRTAVFMEQPNGTFKGVYVHYDGYLEGVGQNLLDNYQDREKVQRLIDIAKPIASLGTDLNLVSDSFKRLEDGETRISQDTTEQFFATSLEEIRHERYLTLGENREIIGYYSNQDEVNGNFREFLGSDNNGFIYVYDKDGDWLVAQYKDTMPPKFAENKCYFKEFEPLKQALRK